MPGRDSKERLLRAATEAFAEHGLRGTRVQTIVKRARVNERMIYHHFESKEGLYRAVLEAAWRDVADAWRPHLAEASELGPREGLTRAFEGVSEVFVARPTFLRLVLHEAMNGWPFAPPATFESIHGEVLEMFARGVEQGVLRADVSFQTLYTTLLGTLSLHLFLAPRFADTRDADPRALASASIRLVMDGACTTRPAS